MWRQAISVIIRAVSLPAPMLVRDYHLHYGTHVRIVLSERDNRLVKGAAVSADAVTEDPRRMVRLRKAAVALDIPESTLRKLCAAGKVPSRKVGRNWRVSLPWVNADTDAEIAS